ncbi:MAG TPA: Fe2+-dicitrate sensor, membrane component [Gammaproteobacteria bacterium]|nr:Fe2+-dicitrate sensor, membrane component [Gammaproteobacteria bacterium]
MHSGDGVTEPTVSRDVARSAASWLSLLHSGEASAEDLQACLAWRQASPEHELAWSRAEVLQQKLGLIPESLGMKTLGREQRQDRRRAIKTLALLIAAGPLAYGIYRGMPWQVMTADYRTATGEQRHLTLADGTDVHLNTATTLDVSFTPQQRLLTLHAGEILIETGSDQQANGAAHRLNKAPRPMLVSTAQGDVRPIGTRFIVRQLEGVTRLGVMEGEVEIHPNKASTQRLSAGEQADFSQHRIHATQSLPAEADAWSRGVLYANNMPLGQFVQELARYRNGVLRCDPAAVSFSISGVFQLDNTDRILAALPDTLPVEVNSVMGVWVTVKAR